MQDPDGSLAANGTHVLGRADRDRSGYLGCGFRGGVARRDWGSHVSGRTALSGAVEPANASVGEPPRQPESREMG